jgi:hypothetical protein
VQILELLGRRRVAGLALGAVASGILAAAAVFVFYQPGYEASGRVFVGQVVGTGATQYELAPYSAALITSLEDSGLTATDLGGGQVEAVASGQSRDAASQALTAAVGKALGVLADNSVSQNELAANSAQQVIAELTERRELIREAAGASDLPTEYQARTVDLLDLRNSVAAGGSAELKELLAQKEAELATLVSQLSDYQSVQQQLDQVSQSYAVASRDLALSQARRDRVSSEPVIEGVASAAVPTMLTAVRAGLAAAVLFAGLGLLVSLIRARKADSPVAVPEVREPSLRQALEGSAKKVPRHGPKRAARL